MTSAAPAIAIPSDEEALEAARHAMVASQLRTSGVTDPRLIRAMAEVPRERFMPAGFGELAYRDRALPLGHGREQNAPLATARLLGEAAIRAGDSVMLIGAASGYTAALIAHLGSSVVAVESDTALAASAGQALAGTAGVRLVEGALADGHEDAAPYDAIVVDGAVEQLPDALVAQVREGGRIASGIVERGVTRLAAGTRTAGGFALTPFADIDCVVLPGFARPRGFSFPG